jgi:hypothetical protein
MLVSHLSGLMVLHLDVLWVPTPLVLTPLTLFACLISHTSKPDYQDIQMRDPEDRVDGMTIGVGRAILSNRISHFLNIKGARYKICGPGHVPTNLTAEQHDH